MKLLPAKVVCTTWLLIHCVAFAAYYAATLLLEVGWLQIASHSITTWLKKRFSQLRQRRLTQQGYEQTASDSAAEAAEDEDVQEERIALQTGMQLLASHLFSCCQFTMMHCFC